MNGLRALRLHSNHYFLLIFLILFFIGCAASSHRQGLMYLNKKEYNEAIAALEEAEQEKPGDYRIKRDLGTAFYKARRFDDALARLKAAKELNSKDSKTVFYTGLTYEAKDMLAEAIDEYKSYLSLGGSRKFRKEIAKRIKQLTREKIAAEISKAFSQEQNLNVTDIPKNTIAVLSFKNLGQSRQYDPLQKGLAHMLVTDLSKVKSLRVVERLKLQKLLEELELGQTGLVDEATAPRVGKLIGAQKLVNGSFTDLADDDFRIDAAVAETATTRVSEVGEVTGKLDKLFQMQKDLAFSIIDDLGIQLSTEEREAIRKIPTESLLAFIAYSKGLDFEDRGMFEEAKQEYGKAVKLDPNFALAKQNREEVEVAESAATEPKAAAAEMETDFESSEFQVGGGGRTSRLLTTSFAAQTGQTPQGDNDTREPLQEDTGTDAPVSSNAKISIRVPLPPNNE